MDKQTNKVTGWFVGCLIKVQKGVKFDQDENQRTGASLGCPTHVSPSPRPSYPACGILAYLNVVKSVTTTMVASINCQLHSLEPHLWGY